MFEFKNQGISGISGTIHLYNLQRKKCVRSVWLAMYLKSFRVRVEFNLKTLFVYLYFYVCIN